MQKSCVYRQPGKLYYKNKFRITLRNLVLKSVAKFLNFKAHLHLSPILQLKVEQINISLNNLQQPLSDLLGIFFKSWAVLIGQLSLPLDILLGLINDGVIVRACMLKKKGNERYFALFLLHTKKLLYSKTVYAIAVIWSYQL